MAAWNSIIFPKRESYILHFFLHCRAASTVIPLLPKATFTPSIQPNLGLPLIRPPNFQINSSQELSLSFSEHFPYRMPLLRTTPLVQLFLYIDTQSSIVKHAFQLSPRLIPHLLCVPHPPSTATFYSRYLKQSTTSIGSPFYFACNLPTFTCGFHLFVNWIPSCIFLSQIL